MKIAAVIVTFNRIEKLKETVSKSLYSDFSEIVVVNNHSSDGTKEWLSTVQNNKLTVLNLEENTGGAGGFKAGLKFVYKNLEVDWICLFDDDAYPDDGALTEFIKMNKDDLYGVAAAVYHKNKVISEMNRPSVSPYRGVIKGVKALLRGKSLLLVTNQEYRKVNYIKEIDSSSFVGFFLNLRYLIETECYPDESLFIYSDDSIYISNMTKKGYRVVFNSDIHFVHDCQSIDESGMIKPVWKAYYLYRNGLLWLKQESRIWFWLLLPVKFIVWMSRARHSDNKYSYFRLLFKAVLDALRSKKNISHESIIRLSKF